MKHLATALFATAALASGLAQAATLEVQVKGTEGEIMVAVYDSAEAWMKKPLRGVKASVGADGQTVLRIEDLPDGDYAISLLHDTNGNGKMDFNLFGKPTEKFGFSNKAAGSFGPPKFDAARFSVTGDTVQVIELF